MVVKQHGGDCPAATLRYRALPILQGSRSSCARTHPVALLIGWLLSSAASAQPPPNPSTVLRAQTIRGTPDAQTTAQGEAELVHDGMVIRADQLSFDRSTSMAQASGNVEIRYLEDTFRGPELQLQLQTYQGFFLAPSYQLSRNGASGRAQRVDFLDRRRWVSTDTTYSTCTPDAQEHRDWELSAKRLTIDHEKNEGVAEGAVLRFMDVPILAAPSLSFPLGKERKSGWLPLTYEFDTRSGPQVSAPYYWNIAPSMDATLTPQVLARRGVGMGTQLRYLGAASEGDVNLQWVPNDRVAERNRYGLDLFNNARFGEAAELRLRVQRVSDDNYWKDFHRGVGSLTPRLLRSDLGATHTGNQWNLYAQVQSWQVLQSTVAAELIDPPYQRTPQIGARTQQLWGNHLRFDMESEFNHFTNPSTSLASDRPTGSRVHTVASISRGWVYPAWSVTPKLSFNAATYAMDEAFTTGLHAGRKTASRVIPTFSLDSQGVLERQSTWFGQPMLQTLEPRLVYSHTPYKDQSGLPIFDSAPIDITFDSIFFDNPFSGIDRVADSQQITAGLSTRLIDADTGGQMVQLGVAQRYRLNEQLITPDGTVSNQRFSDVFLLGSADIAPRAKLNATVQYSPEQTRVQRSVVDMRYSPGPLRALSLGYNSDRIGSSEQVSMGWQWPVYGPPTSAGKPWIAAAPRPSNMGCTGTWYSVGHVSMNTRDHKLVDSILGLEYDGGCWVGRVVGRRQSTGINEYVTGIGLQLELVGLSRLSVGANPSRLWKEHVGGYQPLRGEQAW